MISDRLYKHCLFATVLLSVFLYAYAEFSVAAYAEISLGLAGFAVPFIALGWWLTEGRAKFRWPGWATYVAVALIVLRGITRAYTDGVDIAVFCEFLVLILLYKVWDHRHSRDHGQILTLCAFLAIGSILTGTSLLVGLLLFLLVPLLLASVMMYQVRPDDRLAIPARSVAAGPGRTRIRREFAVSLFFLWIGSIAVFVYFPREIGFGAFGAWGQRMLTSGFTDRVELGRAGLISESQETVLELELRDGLDRVLGGPGQVYYLRGAVLDDYRPDTGSWVRSERGVANEIELNPVRRSWPLSDMPGRRPPEQKVIQTITLFEGAAGPIFSIWRPMEVAYLSQSFKLLVQPRDLSMRHSQSSGLFRYSVVSFRGTDSGSRVRYSRDASFDSDVVRETAIRVLAQRRLPTDAATRTPEDDASAATAIEEYLRTTFSYTLEIQAPPRGADPIDWFLSTARRGHCEYFASAMAAMCRSVGVNARVVTGYVATEWDADGRKYVVRQSNAHAWVEARGAGGVWRTYDPTPPADLRRVHQPPQDLASRIRRFFYAAENRWATGVVGYDESARRQLVGSSAPVISWIEAKMRAVSEARTPRAAREARSELRRFLLSVSGSLLGLVVLILLARPFLAWLARLRAGAAARAARRPQQPGLGFYADLLAALERRGLAKPPGRPPLLHAQALAHAHPALADDVASVASLYYRATFGGQPISDPERAHAENLVRALARNGDASTAKSDSRTPHGPPEPRGRAST